MGRENHGVCFFDAFGTLIYPEPAAPEVYFQVGQKFGDQRPKELLAAEFNLALNRHLNPESDLSTNAEREQARWRSVVQQLFGHLPDCDAVFELLWAHFADSANWRVYGDVEGTLSRLAEAGFELGIASNFDARLAKICLGLPPLRRMRYVFTSAAIGWRKPSPRFFQSIKSALCREGHMLWMIGDNRKFDAEAARRDGWNAILLDRTQTITVQQLEADLLCVPSLAAVPQLILSD